MTKFIADQTAYRKSYNTPYYLPPVNDADEQSGGGMVDMQNIDSMFEEAAKLVVISQMGSTSALQRKLGSWVCKGRENHGPSSRRQGLWGLRKAQSLAASSSRTSPRGLEPV